ncbi:MAG: outer membrane protein assembly factor BamD [Gammaproteobacteria bacterium]|nr:outer membrane protein assembly factor BamD [Gammaproteobacteria bacterium]MCH9763172.1 outer membrane protein assembly factor BamD [Gammaproteobacteria bacterium]
MKAIKYLIVLGLFVTLVGCKTLTGLWSDLKKDDEDEGPFKGQSASKLYTDARASMKKKDYTGAIKRLEAMETMYPFHDNAEKAELELIYAYYVKEDYVSAGASAERFIHLYPRAKQVDYAYYIKAMSNFHQLRGPVATMLPMDQSYRDPGTQSQAYSDFATLVQLFPNSEYKANSEQHMIYLRNMFAKSELNVSKYYFERRRYVASAERASYLIQTYPQASSVKEALGVLYHANQALGLNDAAKDALKVYQDTYGGKPPEVGLS